MKKMLLLLLTVVLLCAMCSITVLSSRESEVTNPFLWTFWSLVP